MKSSAVSLMLVLVALAAPLAAERQPAGKVHRIGVMTVVPTPNPRMDALLQGLRERGYVEGKNLVLEVRFSEGRNERVADFAAELVRLRVDLIVTATNAAAQAAQKATNTIPIVMAISGSPEQFGLVACLARPAGNVTGLSLDIGPEIAGKMLQLLKDAVPKISRVATLRSGGATSTWFEESGALAREIHAAGQGLGLTLVPLEARGPDDFAGVLAAARKRAEALLVAPSGLSFFHRRLIVETVAKQRLPAVYTFREFVDDGGLMSYGVDVTDLYRRSAIYVDKILKGAKPGDLPIEQPTKFELVINMKTAKALGLTVPKSLLLRANHVIE